MKGRTDPAHRSLEPAVSVAETSGKLLPGKLGHAFADIEFNHGGFIAADGAVSPGASSHGQS